MKVSTNYLALVLVLNNILANNLFVLKLCWDNFQLIKDPGSPIRRRGLFPKIQFLNDIFSRIYRYIKWKQEYVITKKSHLCEYIIKNKSKQEHYLQ